jgi:hypothetical protein
LPNESRINKNTALPFDGCDAVAPETDCSAVSNRPYRTVSGMDPLAVAGR